MVSHFSYLKTSALQMVMDSNTLGNMAPSDTAGFFLFSPPISKWVQPQGARILFNMISDSSYSKAGTNGDD